MTDPVCPNTGAPTQPDTKPKRSLYERIRDKAEAVGGIDIDLPPRDTAREPRHFNQTLAEVRSEFAHMPPEELEALIEEAVAAVRIARSKAPDTVQIEALEPGHMRHADFRIGGVFWCDSRQWRCTDIGTRVITAIRLDHVDVESTAPGQRRTLSRSEAEAEGWFNGPPYAVAETVFDEYDIKGCTREPEPDDNTPSSSAPNAGTDADTVDAWDNAQSNARQMAQAKSLRDQARAGGLRFEVYLPSSLADWLLAHIECGNFHDPSEAVFVMLGEQQELEPHADLRREFFKRRIQAGIDSGPGVPAEEVFARLRKSLAEPRPEPAVWPKKP
jgi:Arc/MetJ-type ribon-helix-helix transcriptional regulator